MRKTHTVFGNEYWIKALSLAIDTLTVIFVLLDLSPAVAG